MLFPNDGALCYLNGRSVCQPVVLGTGSRVILGRNHVFRFTHPEQGQRGAQYTDQIHTANISQRVTWRHN